MIFEKQIVKIYKKMMFNRCDDLETVYYFSNDDFKGLNAIPYVFKSSLGHNLKGYLYYYDNPIENRIIVFDHGFGGGHKAYMKEIEILCKKGYKVFSYDHTGCMESEGDSPNGLAQSLCDLNDCIINLKSLDEFKTSTISVVGHSWGAFSTLNISSIHPEITHIVAIAGFVSVPKMINTFFSGLMKIYRKAIVNLETETNPKFVNYDATESLLNTKTKSLLIYSKNDQFCKIEHYDMLKKALNKNKNIDFLLVEDKYHNPNYTVDAVNYLNEFTKKRTNVQGFFVLPFALFCVFALIVL